MFRTFDQEGGCLFPVQTSLYIDQCIVDIVKVFIPFTGLFERPWTWQQYREHLHGYPSRGENAKRNKRMELITYLREDCLEGFLWKEMKWNEGWRLFTLRRDHLGTIGLNNQPFSLPYWEDLLQDSCNRSCFWLGRPCGKGKILILKETNKTAKKPLKYTICLKTLLHFCTKIYCFPQGGPECRVMQRITLTLYAQ